MKHFRVWRERWASHVVIPVYYALPEKEVAFMGTQQHLDECVQVFTKSKRVEGSLIPGAPHCMELSYWSSSWYARCFEFAMECAVTFDRSGTEWDQLNPESQRLSPVTSRFAVW